MKPFVCFVAAGFSLFSDLRLLQKTYFPIVMKVRGCNMGNVLCKPTFQKMDHMTRILDLIAVGSKTGKVLALIVVSCSLGKTFGTRQNFWN